VYSDRNGDLYLSLEGRATDGMIDVNRIVVTHAPAQPLKPIKLVSPGTVDSLDEAEVLRMRNRDPFTAALLERARQAVRDRRPGAPVLLRAAGGSDERPAHGWIDYDGQPVAGPMRHGPPGAVISVR
jgi:hypothetical protein